MEFVSIPQWFKLHDVGIDLFSFLILLVFFILCTSYYRMAKKKSFLYLGIGFLLIAVGQLAYVITKIPIYYNTSLTTTIGNMIVTYHIVNSIASVYFIGFFAYKLLTLVGFYIIYRLLAKEKFSGEFVLALFFIVISVIMSATAEYLFHITIIILLILIIARYYQLYKENRSANTGILMCAFMLLFISHIILAITGATVPVITANIIELLSYVILLLLIIRILRAKG